MRIKLILSLLLGLFAPLVFAVNSIANPQGFWQLADKNGNPKIIIHIYGENEKLHAKLLQYLPNQNARCTKCEGALQNQPYRNLVIISNLIQKDASTWTDGKILNPETGEISNVTLTINRNGDAIRINSYGWFSWFGSTDVWTRRN